MTALSKAQKRHLAEMLNPETGESRFWRPINSGERACAFVLRKKGLLRGQFVTWNDGYELSDEGLTVARSLLPAGLSKENA